MISKSLNLTFQGSSPIAIFRDGNYPVSRGTFIDLRGKGFRCTRGSVPYYGTYPGLRVPRPLLLVPHIAPLPRAQKKFWR
jgi:hypothetical protein